MVISAPLALLHPLGRKFHGRFVTAANFEPGGGQESGHGKVALERGAVTDVTECPPASVCVLVSGE